MNNHIKTLRPILLLTVFLMQFSGFSYAAQDAFDELKFETGGCDAELNDAKRRVSVCESKAKKYPALRKELLSLQSKFGALEYAANNKIAELETKLKDINSQVRAERANNQRLRNEIIDLARPR
jgi:Tfp pilus assembly protein PilO